MTMILMKASSLYIGPLPNPKRKGLKNTLNQIYQGFLKIFNFISNYTGIIQINWSHRAESNRRHPHYE